MGSREAQTVQIHHRNKPAQYPSNVPNTDGKNARVDLLKPLQQMKETAKKLIIVLNHELRNFDLSSMQQ